jgi:uncharacterized damage-inducible protein DinB
MKKLLVFIMFLAPCLLVAQSAVQNEAIGFISYSKDRVLQLADKFSEKQLDWRPGEGVRSVGEVLLHIAGGNYYFIMSSGGEAPAGLDVQNIETTVKGREDIVKTLTGSYDAIVAHIGGIQDAQLGDKVELPWPGNHTKMTIVMLGVDHTSEHLGQLIAYARMNGITPPWSE